MCYITKEKLEEIKKQLEYLKTAKRAEIVQRIKEAKEMGDISENAELDVANEERGMNEVEISKLEDIVRHAKVVESENVQRDWVGIGSTVTFSLGQKEVTYTLVGAEDSDLEQGKISNESPMGSVLMGHKVGENFEANLPSGKMEIKILNIK